jgi:hypothetical protein
MRKREKRGQAVSARSYRQAEDTAPTDSSVRPSATAQRFSSTAFYHSAVNYTTLGSGDLILAPPWRLLGPMEARDGMLMAGVSAAILFAVLHRLVEHRLSEPRGRA